MQALNVEVRIIQCCISVEPVSIRCFEVSSMSPLKELLQRSECTNKYLWCDVLPLFQPSMIVFNATVFAFRLAASKLHTTVPTPCMLNCNAVFTGDSSPNITGLTKHVRIFAYSR